MKQFVHKFRLYLAGIILLVGGSFAWASTTKSNPQGTNLQTLVENSKAGLFNMIQSSEELADAYSEELGDANCDGAVDVVDVTTTVDFILQKSQPTDQQFLNTDVNQDKAIDVVDLTSIVSIILGTYKPANEVTGYAPASRLLTEDHLLLNGTDIILRNNLQYQAFQMDVTLTDGAQLNDVLLTQRADDHLVAFHMIDYNTYRILAYSLTGTPFAGNTGTLLTLNVSGNQQMTITDILFTDGISAYLLGIEDVTRVNPLGIDAQEATVYDLNGRRVFNVVKNGIYIINGKKVSIK